MRPASYQTIGDLLVVVWDDGDSMDVEALKKLWWIARSPKDDGTDRVRTVDGRTRSLIGKFGIGKQLLSGGAPVVHGLGGALGRQGILVILNPQFHDRAKRCGLSIRGRERV